jgi:hypothetical protein
MQASHDVGVCFITETSYTLTILRKIKCSDLSIIALLSQGGHLRTSKIHCRQTFRGCYEESAGA